MNYEQEYKKAFEAAKGLHDAGNALTKKQMEIVFPKLAESEDERIRKFLLRLAERCNENSIDFMGEIKKKDVIAYLEKQKEQKPAEWSEEDERIRKAILGFLNPDKGGTKYSSNAELVEWSDWLKSLRPVSKESLQPHWKPSEEQMEALLKAVDKARELHYSSNSGYDEYDIIRSLYKQLKELNDDNDR